MQSGRLRERITILNAISSRDESGQIICEWNDGATVWAEVRSISGRELIASGAETADATIRVWIRFRRDVTTMSRLRVLSGPFKGEVLNVSGPPVPDGKGTRLEILCKTGVET